MRKLTSLTLVAFLLGAPATLRAQETPEKPAEKKADVAPPAPPAVPGAEVLSLPGEARGDAASQLDDLLKAISERPDDPASVLGTDLLGNFWDLVPDGRKKVRDALEKVAGASPAAKNGWALDRYKALLEELRLADGDAAGALEIAQSRGYVRQWMAVGPFGYSQKAILDVVFPPEVDARQKTIEAKTQYATTKGELAWTRVPARQFTTSVNFSRALRSTNGACYVLAQVESSAEQDVTFVFEGGAAKLFLNRALVGTVDRHRQRLDGRVQIDAHLHKGWNRIVVKTGDWSSNFALRIATRDGFAIPDLKVESAGAFHDVAADTDSDKPVRESWVVETLARETNPFVKREVEPARRALYAYALLTTGRAEEGYTVLEQLGAYPKKASDEDAKKTAPAPEPLAKSAWFWVLAAEAAEQADHLPDQAKRVEARRAYEKALSIDPYYAGARRRLADYDIEDDKAKEGLSGFEDVLERCPADDSTRIRLYGALMDLGWQHEAEKVLAELESRGKDLPAVLQAKVRWVEAKGDRKTLQGLFEKQLENDKRNIWVYERREQLALASGDAIVAKQALEAEEKASWDTEEGEYDLKRAELARSLGDRDGEIDSLKKALDARPQDLDLRERLARAYADRAGDGDDKRSLALLDDLLEVEPHRLTAQNLRNALQSKPDEFWKPWEYSAKDLLKTAPGSKEHPDASVICLQDQTVTKIRRDGSCSEVVHETYKILDDDGKEAMGKRPQAGDLMSVRVFTPGGEVLEPIRAGREFEMPGLEPGAVVEHEWRQERAARDFQFTNGPWFLRDPDLQQPYIHSRWVVIAPKDMNLEAIEKNLDANKVKKTVIEQGDQIVRIWESFDQDRIEPEPNMPAKEEFLPWVKLWERRSLEDMAGMYVDQSLGRTYVTPSIQAKADELCSKLEGDTAKIKAIYSFVKEHCTRGQGGETAAQILAAKGGSKTTLMMALLDAAKVPYKFALAASSPDLDESTDWDHPEPFQFRMPVLRLLPRDGSPSWLYADGPRYVPMDLLPNGLWGAPAIVCDGASGRLDVLPRGNPADAGTRTHTTVELLPGGKAKASVTQEILQMESYALKEAVKNMPKSRIQNFAAQAANQLFTGARLKGWETPRLEDPAVPFTISLKLEADHVVRKRANGELTVTTGLDSTHLKEAFGGTATRRFDLVLRGWTATRDEVLLDLGPYACSRLPADVQQECKYGQYSLVFVREGNKLRIERSLTLFPRRVTPSEYKDFLNFIDKVDAAEKRPLVVEAAAGAASASPDKEDSKSKPDKDDDDDDK